MTRTITMLGSAGLGAGLMYFFDRSRGRRRRAVVRDKTASARREFQRELDKAGRDMDNRVTGLVTEVRKGVGSVFTRDEDVDDSVLESRVRSRMGHHVRHPHAIEVTANRGVVTLKGDVLAEEVGESLSAIRLTPGVRHVKNEIRVHESSDGVPGLQGNGRARPGREGWTPALRVLAGFGGGALAVFGLSKPGVAARAARLTGTALLARAVFNRNLKRVAGFDDDPSVDIQKTIHVDAPVKQVFAFLTDFTNLPRFMAHLREVRDLGDRKYHWVAEGPAGVPVAWDGKVTKLIPDKLLEWTSLPDARIVSRGSIRFDPGPGDSTRITVRMAYAPPAGMIGHTVASILGADPKHEMDDDFVRLKSLLETGKTRVKGTNVTLPEISG